MMKPLSKILKQQNLKAWNRMQTELIRKLGIETEPRRLLQFGAWFARHVDQSQQFPRLADAIRASHNWPEA